MTQSDHQLNVSWKRPWSMIFYMQVQNDHLNENKKGFWWFWRSFTPIVEIEWNRTPGFLWPSLSFHIISMVFFEQNQWSLHKPGSLPPNTGRLREWGNDSYTSIPLSTLTKDTFSSLNTIQNPIAPHAWMDFRYDFRHILLRFHISERFLEKWSTLWSMIWGKFDHVEKLRKFS